MRKIKFLDERVRSKFSGFLSYFSTISSIALIFFNIPDNIKIYLFIIFAICLILFYFRLWSHLNNLREIELDVEGSKVTVKSGDLFKQDGLKAIAFNEYFDTQVDEIIISSRSLNGTYIKKYFRNTTSLLDDKIENYDFDESEYIEINNKRKKGKTKKYSLGTICVVDDFILTAFSRFDEDNKAYLTMPDYLSFLITFWDKVNKIYAQRDVSVPIFGSGITRIKEHRNISDEELLKIMLWTFRISEMRFKYPARLTIVISEDKIDTINLLDIKSARNGI
ncbi:hypothetical protein G7090_00380 [Leclercia sp. 29361]|uniref:macro domain-containing protein n=1 Tax=Leclercia sp. 29361 TaxID=2714951 RepID=UPI00140D1185|nr:macro domain-containing protein [Leclercia sp. 29361]QIK11920.1 hypothetical protein G7090_00380 [Leclercia sp. 29361]